MHKICQILSDTVFMDYPFENLGPEKFQLFCQALLAREYPSLQCLPVGQPDGGRDLVQYYPVKEKSIAVFQVKFVRNPLAEKEPHKWLERIIAEEAPKTSKEVFKKCILYILITNAPGTAHPEVGSIDKMNSLLSEATGIHSICWWRNDLSRRLDDAWNLKWIYPELMVGPDLIRMLVESGLTESREQRLMTIRAFIAHQFKADEEVKFKQVDLQNRLLDLFIDVPIVRDVEHYWSLSSHTFVTSSRYKKTDEMEIVDIGSVVPSEVFQRKSRNGAATFLLNFRAPKFIVLEGAPGQGKSTITQYICQVHRMRLLDRKDQLSQVEECHRSGAVNLPFKIDLRDLASWLAKYNPFSADGEIMQLASSDRTLEGFLAALVSHQSGGAIFTVVDLHAVFRVSSVLVVLDGLDEVADIKRRGEVVKEIEMGVNRLKSIAASLQVVVTSRPTAFANSPGLPEESFSTVSLDAVTGELIEEYADKWLKARRLDQRQSAEVKRILRDKLSQAHTRDLARNPMQLAILLSLIHTQGTSLPDKRTSLYDSYVRLFFNREAEKSEIVRENRDLLIDIHRYLAWLLHTEAEQSAGDSRKSSNGAIPENRLKEILCGYLKSEGYEDGTLPDKLFTGVVERVVALVSRVEGTYEFEVQPLREYFAARYLYETAPYSPVGHERRGTKPDRFAAIARDFYWLNVARFYAGCYSKGELASLIDGLNDLIEDTNFKFLSHPRVLTSTLLSDWVFTQHPKSVSEVIRLMMDGIGLRFLLTSNSRRLSPSQPLILASACGRSELVNRCMFMLRQAPPADYALDIIDLLRANGEHDEIQQMWLDQTKAAKLTTRSKWLGYGLHLGCVSNLSAKKLSELLSDMELDDQRIEVLWRAKRTDIVEQRSDYFLAALEALVNRRIGVLQNRAEQYVINLFGRAIDPARYADSFRSPVEVPLRRISGQRGHAPERVTQELQSTFATIPTCPKMPECIEIVKTVSDLMEIQAQTWATELAPWNRLISSIVESFGECWAAIRLAMVAAGVRSGTETCTEFSELFDKTKPLCMRVRYARLRAGNANWWITNFRTVKTDHDRTFLSALWFSWASFNSILIGIDEVDKIVVDLPQMMWEQLFDSVEEVVRLAVNRPRGGDKSPWEESVFDKLSLRSFVLLTQRMSIDLESDILFRKIVDYDGDDRRILKVTNELVVNNTGRSSTDWEASLKVFERAYKNDIVSERYSAYQLSRRPATGVFPVEIAIRVAENADRYPSFVVAEAERVCRQITASQILPVAAVAQRDGWFQ